MKKYISLYQVLNILVFIVFAFGFTGCDKWINGQTIEYDLERTDPVLTLLGFWESGSDTVDFFIGRSQNLNAIVKPPAVEEVKAKLYKNNTLLKEWEELNIKDTVTSFDPNTGNPTYFISDRTTYQTILPEVISTDEDKYRLEISAKDFETIRAEVIAPPKANVVQTSLDTSYPINETGYVSKGHKIQLKIDDPANAENHYMLECTAEYAINNQKKYQILLLTKQFGGGSSVSKKQIVYSDDDFNGRVWTFEQVFKFYADDIKPVKYHLRVIALSKEYVEYFDSLEREQNANENPLAEPFSIYSNVENGTGILSIFNASDYILE